MTELANNHFPIMISLKNETETLSLGEDLSKLIQNGMYVALEGDLGVGKTTLTRGILRGLGFKGIVKSPSYSIVETYKVHGLHFHHFDFFRFNSAYEFAEAGLEEKFNPMDVCVVEWPEKAKDYLPKADLKIKMNHRDLARSASITSETLSGLTCLKRLKKERI